MSKANGGSTAGAPASGYYVEVETPNGHVHTPTTMDEPAPKRTPTANGLPTISIPVRKNEKWSDEAFEDAPMRVWYDGERQPIDRLEEREQTPSATVLRGRGGLELKRRFTDEVRQERATAFVERAVGETTGYMTNVDEPDTEREDGVFLDGAQRDGDFETRLSPADAEPIVIGDAQVRLAQTCYPQDGRKADFSDASPSLVLSDDAYNQGGLHVLEDTDDWMRFQFQTETQIPAKHVGIKIRDQHFGAGRVEVRWDSTLISRLVAENALGWREVGAYTGNPGVPTYQSGVGTTIEAGEPHTLEFRAITEPQWGLDAVALYDRRYAYSWPNPGSENGGGALSGPELYPPRHALRPDAPTPPRTVVGGHLDVAMGDGGTADELGISNTQRDDYGGGYDIAELGIDFKDPGPSLQPRIVLGRRGDDPGRGTIPTTGFKSQRLNSYALRADLEGIPMVVNQSFDAPLVDVLSAVADNANSIFEYRREGALESVEWTQPGARTVERAPTAADFEITSSTAERVQKAVVYGATRDVRNETLVVLAGEKGTSVDLTHKRLRQGSVVVRNTTTGVEMTEGDDYAVGYQAGVIDTDEQGRMDENTEYDVSYSYQTYGEYADPGVESPRETVKNATGITSNFAAQQAAKTAVEKLSTPVEQGTITLTGDAVGFSVVDGLAAADIPGGPGTGRGGLRIREIASSPGETTLRLGTHRTFDDFVGEVESNIAAVEREL